MNAYWPLSIPTEAVPVIRIGVELAVFVVSVTEVAIRVILPGGVVEGAV
jgi:hypothetical protein